MTLHPLSLTFISAREHILSKKDLSDTTPLPVKNVIERVKGIFDLSRIARDSEEPVLICYKNTQLAPFVFLHEHQFLQFYLPHSSDQVDLEKSFILSIFCRNTFAFNKLLPKVQDPDILPFALLVAIKNYSHQSITSQEVKNLLRRSSWYSTTIAMSGYKRDTHALLPTETIQKLIEAGAAKPIERGPDILSELIRCADYPLEVALLLKEADYDMQNPWALGLAIKHGHFDVANILLQAYQDLPQNLTRKIQDELGQDVQKIYQFLECCTPPHNESLCDILIPRCFVDCDETQLKAVIQEHFKDGEESVPWIMCALRSHLPSVYYMLEKIPNTFKRFAREIYEELIREHPFLDVKPFLRQGIPIPLETAQKFLEEVVFSGDKEAVKLLIEAGAKGDAILFVRAYLINVDLAYALQVEITPKLLESGMKQCDVEYWRMKSQAIKQGDDTLCLTLDQLEPFDSHDLINVAMKNMSKTIEAILKRTPHPELETETSCDFERPVSAFTNLPRTITKAHAARMNPHALVALARLDQTSPFADLIRKIDRGELQEHKVLHTLSPKFKNALLFISYQRETPLADATCATLLECGAHSEWIHPDGLVEKEFSKTLEIYYQSYPEKFTPSLFWSNEEESIFLKLPAKVRDQHVSLGHPLACLAEATLNPSSYQAFLDIHDRKDFDREKFRNLPQNWKDAALFFLYNIPLLLKDGANINTFNGHIIARYYRTDIDSRAAIVDFLPKMNSATFAKLLPIAAARGDRELINSIIETGTIPDHHTLLSALFSRHFELCDTLMKRDVCLPSIVYFNSERWDNHQEKLSAIRKHLAQHGAILRPLPDEEIAFDEDYSYSHPSIYWTTSYGITSSFYPNHLPKEQK